MDMRRAIYVGACIAFAAWAAVSLTATNGRAAAELSADALMGRWYGDTSIYDFDRQRLTVTFRSNGARKIFRIKDIEVGDGWINVTWDPRDGGNTVFIDFSANAMAQKDNPDLKMPRREYRRC